MREAWAIVERDRLLEALSHAIAVARESCSLPFVDARVSLVNVAVSRAKDHLIVIGHAPTSRTGQHTQHLLDHAAPLAMG